MTSVFSKKLFEELISQITIGFTDQDILPMTYDDQVEFFSNQKVQHEMRFVCETVMSDMRNDYEDELIISGYNGTFDEYASSLEHGDFRELIYGDVRHDGHIPLYLLYKPYEEKMRSLTQPEDKPNDMLDNRTLTFDEFLNLSKI